MSESAKEKSQAEQDETSRRQVIEEEAREIQERLEEGYSELEKHYGEARSQLQDLNDRAVHFIKKHPGWSLLGAAGLGYFIGRLASKRWLK